MMTETKDHSPPTSSLPLASPEPSSPRPSKRRQSPDSQSDPSSKRPRLSLESENASNSSDTIRASTHASPTFPDAESTTNASTQPTVAPVKPQPPTAEPPRESGHERRKSAAIDERKRGQRLFGGLLSTLSQKVPNTTQKRRQEIEKRQLEKAKAQKAEDEKRRIERAARGKEARRRNQVVWDEESMHMRHTNLRAMAHFLCTKTEPKLYYKPWELVPADVSRIQTQIADTEALILREEEDFRIRHATDLQKSTDSRKAKPVDEEEDVKTGTVGEHRVESSSLSSAAVVPDPTHHSEHENEPTNEVAASVRAEEKESVKTAEAVAVPVPMDTADEFENDNLNGELVVGEEDTVIY